LIEFRFSGILKNESNMGCWFVFDGFCAKSGIC
jgi:hypothetical protein